MVVVQNDCCFMTFTCITKTEVWLTNEGMIFRQAQRKTTQLIQTRLRYPCVFLMHPWGQNICALSSTTKRFWAMDQLWEKTTNDQILRMHQMTPKWRWHVQGQKYPQICLPHKPAEAQFIQFGSTMAHFNLIMDQFGEKYIEWSPIDHDIFQGPMKYSCRYYIHCTPVKPILSACSLCACCDMPFSSYSQILRKVHRMAPIWPFHVPGQRCSYVFYRHPRDPNYRQCHSMMGFLALLCATTQQSYCRHDGVCRPSVKPVFSEPVKQIAKFGGKLPFTIYPDHF